MYVSVHAGGLAAAGYETTMGGLADVALAAVELSIGEECELPRLDAADEQAVYVGHEAGARTYRAHLYDMGVRVSALTLDWELAEGFHEEHIQWTATAVRAAGIIGAGAVRLNPPHEPAETLAAWLCRVLSDIAARTDGSNAAVAVGHGAYDTDCRRDLWTALLELETDRFGVSLAPGLLRETGRSSGGLCDAVRELAPHVRHVDCCGVRTGAGAEQAEPCSLQEGDVDYAQVASVLGAAGYAGPLSLWPVVGDEPRAAQLSLRSDVAYLKDILGEY